MLETQYYNLFKVIVYIIAAIIPFYFLFNSRNISNNSNLKNNNNNFCFYFIADFLSDNWCYWLKTTGKRISRTIIKDCIAFVWTDVSHKYIEIKNISAKGI